MFVYVPFCQQKLKIRSVPVIIPFLIRSVLYNADRTFLLFVTHVGLQNRKFLTGVYQCANFQRNLKRWCRITVLNGPEMPHLRCTTKLCLWQDGMQHYTCWLDTAGVVGLLYDPWSMSHHVLIIYSMPAQTLNSYSVKCMDWPCVMFLCRVVDTVTYPSEMMWHIIIYSMQALTYVRTEECWASILCEDHRTRLRRPDRISGQDQRNCRHIDVGLKKKRKYLFYVTFWHP